MLERRASLVGHVADARRVAHTSSMNYSFVLEVSMPGFDQPHVHAEVAREALRQLANATRQITDPGDIYPILGDLRNGLASLAQSLHQIGDFHDRLALKHAGAIDDVRTNRAASYQVAWELHRAAEMVHQIAAGLDRACELEATIIYDVDALSAVGPVRRPVGEAGLSL
jgi:hypothetical protein